MRRLPEAAGTPAGRAYWRSLGHRAGSEAFRRQLEREFQEGASEPPDGLTRRSMLTLMGASLTLAGLTACRRPVEHIVPYGAPPEEAVPGIPRFYATTMPFGLSAHGLVVETHEGRPTKIEGNALHPSTRGAAGALAQASILGLYDPDRSKRVRARGEDSSWDAFVAAWGELDARHRETGGRGLAVLTREFSSPTLGRLRDAFRARFPEGRFVTCEPVSQENVLEGVDRAAGAPLRPVWRFDRARVVLTLDADPFLLDPEAVAHARGFADGRRLASEGDAMNRLFAVESALSLAGAMADHRRRLRPGDAGAFLLALAAALAARGVSVDGAPAEASPPPGVDAAFLGALAADLAASRGAGLIVAGPWQPPEVHAAALALNAALGNLGRTVELMAPRRDAAPSRAADLATLVAAMDGGAVDTLVVLGGNPAYDAPADLGFAAAMEKVATTIHHGSRLDETGRAAAWHVPEAHFLESWGDARAATGEASVVQPLIEPLYGGKAPVELLGLVATGEARPAHDLVRETWRTILPGASFEAAWRRVLHDGVLPEPARPAPAVAIRPGSLARLRAAAGDDGVDVLLRPSWALWDGRYANNGWLQEAPDPLSKLAWDNAALMAPSTMAAHGLADEDVVRIEAGGRSVELPAWTVPGLADGTVVVALGYGRRAAGRVGDGVGVDAYPLRTTAAPWRVPGASLTKTGARRPLATTQEHGSMEGRPIVREASLEEWRAHPHFAAEAVEMPPLEQPFPDHPYDDGPQWGMSIDLTVCTGCNACVLACQSENNVPVVGKAQVRNGREMHWIRVDRYFAEKEPGAGLDDPEVVFQPVPCMQCENAPCEQVCPVAATTHDSEGLNVMVYNRCIGTRYCSNNCPYKVRRFNFFNFTKDKPQVERLAMNPDVTIRSRGVMEKCTYCTQRINAGKLNAKLEGRSLRDGEIATACQQACPTRAIVFGDIRDAESAVARAKAQSRDYAMLAELNNRPRTTYLAKIRNPHPDLGGA